MTAVYLVAIGIFAAFLAEFIVPGVVLGGTLTTAIVAVGTALIISIGGSALNVFGDEVFLPFAVTGFCALLAAVLYRAATRRRQPRRAATRQRQPRHGHP